jgi:hypothetical protein
MKLSEIRTHFIKFSGRYDLENSDNSDNGANFFINAGQRFLDRRIDFRKTDGKVYRKVATDSWYLTVQNCRTIEHIWASDDEERWELEMKSLLWLNNEYADVTSDTTSKDPLYWAPSNIRGVDTVDMNNLGTFFNLAMKEAANEDYTGIVFLPPPDEAMVLEIWGKFYTPELKDDDDESYWSVVVPETLIQAALYRLEIFYRNTSGANDWLSAIEVDLLDIDKDKVQEDTENVDQLEG